MDCSTDSKIEVCFFLDSDTVTKEGGLESIVELLNPMRKIML